MKAPDLKYPNSPTAMIPDFKVLEDKFMAALAAVQRSHTCLIVEKIAEGDELIKALERYVKEGDSSLLDRLILLESQTVMLEVLKPRPLIDFKGLAAEFKGTTTFNRTLLDSIEEDVN